VLIVLILLLLDMSGLWTVKREGEEDYYPESSRESLFRTFGIVVVFIILTTVY